MIDHLVKINHVNETFINHSENDIRFIGLIFDQKVQKISGCRRERLREGDFEFTDLIVRLVKRVRSFGSDRKTRILLTLEFQIFPIDSIQFCRF